MDDLTRLLAIEDIRRLKARYFYCLDHKDWAGWRDEVFTSDATMDVPNSGQPLISGREEIIDFVSSVLGGVVTAHHGHMPTIDIEAEDRARGLWPMTDLLIHPPNHHPLREGRIQGYGHYRETYVRLPEGWRIRTLRLDYLHFGPVP